MIAEYERPQLPSVKLQLGSTFHEYNELALQYGFLVLFSIAVPVVPLLALLNNLIEFRTDALKIIYASRRVKAEAAAGIGAWGKALRAISLTAVVCNVLYVGLTSDFFQRLSERDAAWERIWPRVVALLIFEHVLILLKLLIDFVVPDVSVALRTRITRDEYLADHPEIVAA